MTTDERDAMPATHWLGMQMEDLDKFFDSLAHRNGSKALRAAIHAERLAVFDAFKTAQTLERAR